MICLFFKITFVKIMLLFIVSKSHLQIKLLLISNNFLDYVISSFRMISFRFYYTYIFQSYIFTKFQNHMYLLLIYHMFQLFFPYTQFHIFQLFFPCKQFHMFQFFPRNNFFSREVYECHTFGKMPLSTLDIYFYVNKLFMLNTLTGMSTVFSGQSSLADKCFSKLPSCLYYILHYNET